MADQLHNDDARFLELLDKWQSGDYTRHDEQELFELAGKDPFRQESLDGLQQFPETDHRAALEKLHRRLHNTRGPGLTFSMRLLSIAAVLVLLLGAVWFFSRPSVEISGNNPIAQHTETPAPVQTEAAPAPLEDKVVPPEAGPAIAKNDRSQPPLPPAASGPAPLERAPEEPVQQHPVVTSDFPGRQAEDEAAHRKPDTLADLGQQESGDYAKSSAPQSDAEGYAIAKAKKRAARKSESFPNQRATSEQTDSALPASKADQPAPGAVPNQGWDVFGQYLRDTARLTPEARANNVSGYVRVQFFVKTSNRPEKFQVIKSLGYGCDEIAIQLIKDWKWQRQSAQPVLVDVPFVR